MVLRAVHVGSKSIRAGYSTEEIIECCQEYLKVKKGIGKPDSRHKGRLARKGTSGRKVFIDRADLLVPEQGAPHANGCILHPAVVFQHHMHWSAG